ncbi:MAG: hypothetical protein ACRDNZ_22230, partial [Streptosporangiaceae bacterium]
MVFIKTRRKQFLLAGPLAAAVTAFTVTACGGGTAATPAQGAPGHWTQAEDSKFTTEAGSGGGASQDSCIIGYFERDMSFGDAMDVVSAESASSTSLSAAQLKTALISKYGTAQGGAIDGQFAQTVTDSNNHCGASAASSTAPAVAPVPTADPAATSESS